MPHASKACSSNKRPPRYSRLRFSVTNVAYSSTSANCTSDNDKLSIGATTQSNLGLSEPKSTGIVRISSTISVQE